MRKPAKTDWKSISRMITALLKVAKFIYNIISKPQ